MRTLLKESSLMLDLQDPTTRNKVCSLIEADQTPVVEADQNSIILALTSKLYQMIVSKVDEIDFGEIPDIKGDVRKLSKYDDRVECIGILHDLIKQYKQDTEPIDQISRCLANIEKHKQIFTRGYMTDVEIIEVTYCEMVLSVVESLSYMIAATIEYVKVPNSDGFQIALDKAGIARTRQSMVYHSLCGFNKACEKDQINKAFEPLIKGRVKKITGVDDLAVIAGVAAIAGILMNILPILRELTFFFFSLRTRVSQYFDIQADLLEMNARDIEMNNSATVGKRDDVVKKQKAIAKFFKAISNKICIDQTYGEKAAPKEIERTSKKMKYDDVVDTNPTVPKGGNSVPQGDSIF